MDTVHQNQFRPVVEKRISEIEIELEAGTEATAAVAPDVSIGRLSRLDSIQMQQMALAGRRRLEQERMRLREALGRIDSGSYGGCPLCGNDIADERLQYQPAAITCVSCQQKKR